MATLFQVGKSFKIQLTVNKRRKTIGLGAISRDEARTVLQQIERLQACVENNLPPDTATQLWLRSLPVKLNDRLAELGYTSAARAVSIGDLCRYAIKELRGSESTQIKRENVKANLIAYFGADRCLHTIQPGDADDFRRWMMRAGGRGSKETLADATVSRRCGAAKSWFKMAVRKGWITENPFQDQKRTSEANRSREFFVDRETIDSLLTACRDPAFRLVMALARYGGLRCPSEIAPLQWRWVDWDEQVIHVRSPKTRHIEGKDIRIVPIFPELRPFWDAMWAAAPTGATDVFPKLPTGGSLTERLATLCRRCKIVLWEKPWQNMRSSRETELVEHFPMHVACAWIGNSPSVAQKHYLQITKEHYRQAVSAAPKIDPLKSAADSLQIKPVSAGQTKVKVCDMSDFV